MKELVSIREIRVHLFLQTLSLNKNYLYGYKQ